MRLVIKVAVQQVAKRRGIENANQLKDATGFPPNMAARLWKGSVEKIGISTLDRLCDVLKCKPNDLLRYEPDGR